MTAHANQPSEHSPTATERHHLRTHLTIIKGYTQLAHRRTLRLNDVPPSLIAYFETILAHINQIVLLLAETETSKPIPPEHGPDEPP